MHPPILFSRARLAQVLEAWGLEQVYMNTLLGYERAPGAEDARASPDAAAAPAPADLSASGDASADEMRRLDDYLAVLKGKVAELHDTERRAGALRDGLERADGAHALSFSFSSLLAPSSVTQPPPHDAPPAPHAPGVCSWRGRPCSQEGC